MSPASTVPMHGRDHCPTGADPIPCLPEPAPGGDTLDQVILGFDPAGFWKLNESGGTTAFDSSGNGLDMTADTGPPLWGAAAGPPGEQTADFETGTVSGTAARVQRTWAALTGDFTVGIWVLKNPTDPGDGDPNLYSKVIGQGNPSDAGGAGWQIEYAAFNAGPSANKPAAVILASGYVEGLNPIVDTDGWKFLALTHNASTTELKFYVDGLLQGTDTTGTLNPSASPLWIGHDGGLGGGAYQLCHLTMSYAFLIPSVLSGTQLLAINDAATPEGAVSGEGKALLATGTGSTEWDYPTEVTYDSTTSRFKTLVLGDNLTGTDNADNTITIDGAPGGDSPASTQAWMPLTTIVAGVPELVWDGDDQLIPTLTDL